MIYFDNAATTFPKPKEVYDYMDDFYRKNSASAGRGQYKMSSESSALISQTKEKLLSVLKCPNREVILTSTATIALNMILQGLSIESDSNVYVTPFEHNAVIKNLEHLKPNIHILDFNLKDNKYNLTNIEAQFKNNNPSFLIMSHASNVTGLIAPIEDIAALAKQYDCTVIIDMCQTAGLIDVNLNYNIYDYIVFAGHKTLYGPLGASGFICNKGFKLKPILFGGTGQNTIETNNNINSFEVGSKNTLAISGLYSALNWIEKIGINNIRARDIESQELLLNILHKYDNIKIIGENNRENSIALISCVFNNFTSLEIAKILNNKDIAIRAGLHCSPNAHIFLGTYPAGTVRFSPSFFTTNEDFSLLDEALKYIHVNS